MNEERLEPVPVSGDTPYWCGHDAHVPGDCPWVPAPEPEGTARDDDPKDDEFQRDYWARIDADREGTPALSEARHIEISRETWALYDAAIDAILEEAVAPLERELEEARRSSDYYHERAQHFRARAQAAEEQLRAQAEALRAIAVEWAHEGEGPTFCPHCTALRALAEQGEGSTDG